jgi:hypothetical protein
MLFLAQSRCPTLTTASLQLDDHLVVVQSNQLYRLEPGVG